MEVNIRPGLAIQKFRVHGPSSGSYRKYPVVVSFVAKAVCCVSAGEFETGSNAPTE